MSGVSQADANVVVERFVRAINGVDLDLSVTYLIPPGVAPRIDVPEVVC